MNDLITRLGSFLNNVVPKTAAISLPGVLGALVLAFVIWPPTPHDEIACVANLGEVEDFNGVARTEALPVGCAADRQSSAGFSLSVTPASASTTSQSEGNDTTGRSLTYAVTAVPSSDLVGDVHLSVISGLPIRAKLSLNPEVIKASTEAGPATLTVSIPPDAPPGVYTITIKGTGAGTHGLYTHSVTVPLNIIDPTKLGSLPNALLKRRVSRELSGVCEFRMRSLSTLEHYPDTGLKPPDEQESWSPQNSKTIAFQNQEVLDGARRDMEECVRLEASHVGEESNQIDKLKYEITIEEKERDALQTQYLAYEKSGSNLAGEYRQKFDRAQARIADEQSLIIVDQQDLRERQAHIDLESDFLKEISARLTDPGRIRPALSFDDYLSGLANHALAIALLAVAAGLVLDPVNTALWGGLFDWKFLDFFNWLRKRRPPVVRVKKSVPPPGGPRGGAPAAAPETGGETTTAETAAKASVRDLLASMIPRLSVRFEGKPREAPRQTVPAPTQVTPDYYSLEHPYTFAIKVKVPKK